MDCKILLVTAFLCHWANGYSHHMGDYPNQPHAYYHDSFSPFHPRYHYHEKAHEDKSSEEDFANANEMWNRPRHPGGSGKKPKKCTGSCAEEISHIFKDSSEQQDPSGPRYNNAWTNPTRNPTSTPRSQPLSQLVIADCIRRCPVTSEHNPVCGTNNITYGNLGRLKCARNCGVQVEISRAMSCSAPVIPSQTPPSLVNINGAGIAESINNWQTSTTTGNDKGNNPNSVNQGNNISTDDKRENAKPNGGNSHNGFGNVNNGNSGNRVINGNCNEGKTKNPPNLGEVMACMQLCPLTSVYDPVCGTDGITYSNPGRLLCSQFCGVDVRVKKFSACSSDVISNIFNNCSCQSKQPVNVEPEVVTENAAQACLKTCFVPDDTTPVCGTNRITYKNLGSLKCARRCGIVVAIEHTGACAADADTKVTQNVQQTTNKPLSLQECLKQCLHGEKHMPLCGTNNITYYNVDHFVCARGCGVDVDIKELSPCSSYMGLPSPLGVQQDTVTANPNGLNFTIPADLLDNIFTNKPPGTESDTDEDIDIDKRFKENINETSASTTKKTIKTVITTPIAH